MACIGRSRISPHSVGPGGCSSQLFMQIFLLVNTIVIFAQFAKQVWSLPTPPVIIHSATAAKLLNNVIIYDTTVTWIALTKQRKQTYHYIFSALSAIWRRCLCEFCICLFLHMFRNGQGKTNVNLSVCVSFESGDEETKSVISLSAISSVRLAKIFCKRSVS
jgi:hypothetical protein